MPLDGLQNKSGQHQVSLRRVFLPGCRVKKHVLSPRLLGLRKNIANVADQLDWIPERFRRCNADFRIHYCDDDITFW